jgi:hypothetical protein
MRLDLKNKLINVSGTCKLQFTHIHLQRKCVSQNSYVNYVLLNFSAGLGKAIPYVPRDPN